MIPCVAATPNLPEGFFGTSSARGVAAAAGFVALASEHRVPNVQSRVKVLGFKV